MAAEGATSTGQGVAVGTPSYMSPEQAAGEEVDSRSDLYGLGVVAYEMLAGHPPFQGSNRVVVSKHIAERPVPIDRVRADCPRPLAGAVMKALEKQPAERWQTGEELRQAVTGERATPRRRADRRTGGPRGRGRRARGAGRHRRAGPPERRAAGRGQPAPLDPGAAVRQPARTIRAVDWMRDGSVSMLGLNLSQWNDLTVVDQERLHDLLGRHDLEPARTSASTWRGGCAGRRAYGPSCWATSPRVGDSLHLAARVYDVASGGRISVARVDDRAGEDARPLFDQLAAKLLDLSGAPTDLPVGLARSTSQSLEAYRAYLAGVDRLNRWDLAGAERDLSRALDDRHHLRPRLLQAGAHPRLAGGYQRLGGRPSDRAGHGALRQPARARPHRHQRLSRLHQRRVRRGARTSTSACWPATPAMRTRGTAWARRGSTTPPARTRRRPSPRRSAPSGTRSTSIPTTRSPTSTSSTCWAWRAEPKPDYALVASDSFALAAEPGGRALVDSVSLSSRCGGRGRRASPPPGAGSRPSRARCGRTGRW